MSTHSVMAENPVLNNFLIIDREARETQEKLVADILQRNLFWLGNSISYEYSFWY